jgi:hypothetical protein
VLVAAWADGFGAESTQRGPATCGGGTNLGFANMPAPVFVRRAGTAGAPGTHASSAVRREARERRRPTIVRG